MRRTPSTAHTSFMKGVKRREGREAMVEDRRGPVSGDGAGDSRV